MIRLFVNAPLKVGEKVVLSAPQSHYLIHVMRLTKGAQMICFNGQDGDWNAILNADKKEWFLLPQQQVSAQQTREKSILCLALIKREPLAFALQKAVELGVGEIRLLQTDRSQSERVNLDHLRAIIVEACEQCERNDVPMLVAPTSLKNVLDDLSGHSQCIYLSERGQTKGKMAPLNPAFFIGPEGGWSERELALFEEKKAFSWHLGKTILRAETAAITALALWHYAPEIKKLAI